MSVYKIIGIHSCEEALKARSPKELKKIYFRPEWEKNPLLVRLAKQAKLKKLKPEVIALKKLNQIGTAHQGVSVFTQRDLKFRLKPEQKNSVVLILDGLQDPRNFGAIIRTAWLVGVDCIFVPTRRTASLSPSTAKAACGGLEYVPIEERNNLSQCLEELKKQNFWIYALDTVAKNSIWEQQFEGRVAFFTRRGAGS